VIDYKSRPIGESAPIIVNAVVEIPTGSSNKYEYDVRLRVFRLDRVLYSPVHYPADYGFIPSTLAEDSDPRYQRIEDLTGVEPHVLKEIEHFFNVYKNLEGRRSLTCGWSGKAEAHQRIETCRVKEV